MQHNKDSPENHLRKDKQEDKDEQKIQTEDEGKNKIHIYYTYMIVLIHYIYIHDDNIYLELDIPIKDLPQLRKPRRRISNVVKINDNKAQDEIDYENEDDDDDEAEDDQPKKKRRRKGQMEVEAKNELHRIITNYTRVTTLLQTRKREGNQVEEEEVDDVIDYEYQYVWFSKDYAKKNKVNFPEFGKTILNAILDTVKDNDSLGIVEEVSIFNLLLCF